MHKIQPNRYWVIFHQEALSDLSNDDDGDEEGEGGGRREEEEEGEEEGMEGGEMGELGGKRSHNGDMKVQVSERM